MATVNRVVSATRGRQAVIALGAMYVVLAVGWLFLWPTENKPFLNILFISILIGVPGLFLLYGGLQLPRTTIHSDFYLRIGCWCLGGIGGMLAVLLLYHLQPADNLSEPYRSVLVLTALSSVAGFGVGMYDAKAETQAREAAQRNQKLQEIQEQLKESNERLEQFAYAASHDLQEPLRMITSYLHLLERRYADDLDEEGEEFIEFAVDGAERMSEMIDGLLAYSRVETQGEPFEPVDLNEELADVQKNLELRITESNADITIDDLPRVTGDRSQLRQVFQNLLSNAIEYSGDETPTIFVTAERNDAMWTISVRDEGIGMQPDQQERIFEPFQRLHSHDEHAGTGIGLALCKRIIERHGGRIWVDSEPGEGATFSFTVPVRRPGNSSPPNQ
ncbi:ATP-binding protein [Natrinema salifodinae]|uniref:histidine kinase n=1 Tax=Natrinema salifodinae TaxID=1202768 RepID=A0A1I0N7S3_9EURY|nr:ATP-binding protein [Natrinema salifodinae]SEV96482.1 4TM region of histidine kinase [Natrinema salifodinae]